jgi:hypothetical protein
MDGEVVQNESRGTKERREKREQEEDNGKR